MVLRTVDALLLPRHGRIERLTVAWPAPESLMFGGQAWRRVSERASGEVVYQAERANIDAAALSRRREQLEAIATVRRRRGEMRARLFGATT